MVEPTGLGLSEIAHARAKKLQEDGHFSQMVDAYKFAIAYAIAAGATPGELAHRKNVFGVATVDPKGEIYGAIKSLVDTGDTPIYHWAERLADWGIMELSRRSDGGTLDIATILLDVQNS